jgi:hypothetical protein
MAAAWNRAAKSRHGATPSSFPLVVLRHELVFAIFLAGAHARASRLPGGASMKLALIGKAVHVRVGKHGEFHRLFVLGRDAELVRRC